MTAPQPLPPTRLANLVKVRPPWSWSNLTDAEAHDLDAQLDVFVADYNALLTTAVTHVIPGCWRQHPAILQTLPVLYWAWWDAHRNPEATIRAAVDFHTRHLPAFQDRLDGLLVDKANAGKCRSGRHQDRPDQDQPRRDAVARSANADPEQRGPDVIDVVIKSQFIG